MTSFARSWTWFASRQRRAEAHHPDADQSSAVEALGMDPLDAQIRQVYFFDTPDLALNKAGVVIRARRIQGRKHDSVVKLRPVVPEICRRTSVSCRRSTSSSTPCRAATCAPRR